jgi:hypothetical protein
MHWRPLGLALLLLAVIPSFWSPSKAANFPGAAAESAEEPWSRSEKGLPHTTGPIITDTTIPQSPGTATLFMPTFLNITGGNFSPNWRQVSAGGNFQALSSMAQLFYGVAPRTEIYVKLSYQHNWAGDVNQPAPNGQRSADFGGPGNISITPKYLLLAEQEKLPAVSAICTTAFPTAHFRHLNPGKLGTDLLGRGAYEFTPGLNFFKYAKPFLLYGNLWYTMYTAATVNGERRYYPDRVSLNLAAEYPLPWKRWVLLLEFVSYGDGGRLLGHRANQPPESLMSTLPALEFIASDDWSFVAGVTIDLFGKNTSFNYTPNFSIFYYF